MVVNDDYYIAGYTREHGEGNQSIKRSLSMHLALSADGRAYRELGTSGGILYAKAQFDAEGIGKTKLLKDPYLFRTKEGRFGVIASRVGESGVAEEEDQHCLLLFLSNDLLSYKELSFLSIKAEGGIHHPVCEYDQNDNVYKIGWYNDKQQFYKTELQCLTDMSSEVIHAECVSEDVQQQALPFGKQRVNLRLNGAHQASLLGITKEEAARLTSKLDPVIHVQTTLPENKRELVICKGESLQSADLAERATMHYSDGSTATKSIVWNEQELLELRVREPGSYVVHGEVKEKTFGFPQIPKKADPNVLFYQGKYYFISTDENGQSRLMLRVADHISDLPSAMEHLVLETNEQLKSCLWAPELHIVGERLTIFFAGGLVAGNKGWQSVQCFVMQLTDNGDPLQARAWGEPQRVIRRDGQPLIAEDKGISLDMTYFTYREQSYVIWAQRNTRPLSTSDLWIASVDTHAPWQLTSDPVRICVPDYGWDRNTTDVDEGPYILKSKGKLYCTFSGSGIDHTYCVGLLTIDEQADLLVADNWHKTGYPIWATGVIPNEYGPGHNSYVQDEDGDWLNIYHAKLTADGSRDYGARRVHFGFDGAPILNMPDDQDLSPDHAYVWAIIHVRDKAAQPITLEQKQGELEAASLRAYVSREGSNRDGAMRLAIRKAGSGDSAEREQELALNNGQPVLYPLLGSKQLGTLQLIRGKNQQLVLLATEYPASSHIFVFESSDGISFSRERRVQLAGETSNQVVRHIWGSYNKQASQYELNWSDGKQGYTTTTLDLCDFAASQLQLVSAPDSWQEDGSSMITINQQEADKLTRWYTKPLHTGFVEGISSVEVDRNNELTSIALPEKVTAVYSDGSRRNVGIRWNDGGVTWSKPGQYELIGEIEQPIYPSPFIRERADPYVIWDEETGYYYFIGSYPTYGHNSLGEVEADGYDRLMLRRARTLEELPSATEVEIWNEERATSKHRYIWAPELHKVAGKWVIFTTSSKESDNVWAIRPVVIVNHGDVMNPADWDKEGHWCEAFEGDDAFTTFSLDMTYFSHRAQHYVVWAEKPAGSRLYIATVDPEQPWKLTSPSQQLSAPDYAWEQGDGDQIDEGPAFWKNEDSLFLFFSASTVDHKYCVGYLQAHEQADLLMADSWHKNPYPILTSDDFADGQQGPGHNSFTRDALGNPVIVYHARTKGEAGDGGLDDPGRHARIKGMHFAADNRPVLNQAFSEEISPEYKVIRVSITIK